MDEVRKTETDQKTREKRHRRTIFINKYAATERDKLLKLANPPAASRPSASYARRSSLNSLKFGGQQIITQSRRNIRVHRRGPSYRRVFLLPVFVTLNCLLFPGPPCVTSFLPVPTLGKNRAETTMHGGRNKPPRTIFRSPNPMFLCSHARNINNLRIK